MNSPLMEMFGGSFGRTEDRIIKSSRLEQQIFDELHTGCEELQACEKNAAPKMPTFKSLVNDTFQSFYALGTPRFTEEASLSPIARKLNKYILNDVMQCGEYIAMKSICEGKELPAFMATQEFTQTVSNELDDLLSATSGSSKSTNARKKLEQQRDQLLDELEELIDNYQNGKPELKDQLLRKAENAKAKADQVDVLNNIVDRNLNKNKTAIRQILSKALHNAQDATEGINNALAAWGDGNSEMKKVQQSDKLKTVAKHLGRFREMITSKRKSGYTYALGEKYDVEYGNNLSQLLTSELGLLAFPELLPVFIRKYNEKS